MELEKRIEKVYFSGSLDGKDINDITRSFIQRFESIKEEREKLHKSALEKTLFSDEVASECFITSKYNMNNYILNILP